MYFFWVSTSTYIYIYMYIYIYSYYYYYYCKCYFTARMAMTMVGTFGVVLGASGKK